MNSKGQFYCSKLSITRSGLQIFPLVMFEAVEMHTVVLLVLVLGCSAINRGAQGSGNCYKKLVASPDSATDDSGK